MTTYKRLEGLKTITGALPSPVMKTPAKTAYEAAMEVPVGDKTVEELAQQMYEANAKFWDYTLKLEPRTRPWALTASWVRRTWLEAAQGRINKERSAI